MDEPCNVNCINDGRADAYPVGVIIAHFPELQLPIRFARTLFTVTYIAMIEHCSPSSKWGRWKPIALFCCQLYVVSCGIFLFSILLSNVIFSKECIAEKTKKKGI